MKYKFTIHAEQRRKKRNVTKEEIIETIRYPDRVLKKHNKYYVQKNIGRGKIEVVYNKTEKYISIITVYWI